MSVPGLRQAVCSFCVALGCVASPAVSETVNAYGLPGYVDMPSAQALADGELALTSAYAGGQLRNTLAFQFTPALTGSYRYSVIDGYFGDDSLTDQSLDLRFQIMDETGWRPALAVGIRDLGGEGIYAGEYLAATKTFGNRFEATLGIGWGRLGERNGFDSPFGTLDGAFATRAESRADTVATSKDFDTEGLFRGDAAVFGGFAVHATDRLSFVGEYSSDLYTLEADAGIADVQSPWNFGASYRFSNGLDLGLYSLQGTEVGARLSYVIDPRNRPFPGGREAGPPPLQPRDGVAAASWGQGPEQIRQGVEADLRAQGITLVSLRVSGRTADLLLSNSRWPTAPQAAGRAARVLANRLPPEVERFRLTFVQKGMTTSTVEMMRSDLYDLEYALEGGWQMYARSTVTDAYAEPRAGTAPGASPRFTFGLAPYLNDITSGDDGFGLDAGIELSAGFAPVPGFILSGAVRQPLIDTTGAEDDPPVSGLDRVRTDEYRYNEASDVEVSHLTAEVFFRPGENVFGRVTAGYLERMYGGVSAEVLWYPVDSRVAFGAELNYAVQRDFDVQFGFRDYSVVTGHASGYWDLGEGYLAQVDVGRYLAGDWGATVSLDREFNNGFKVGAFATVTDVTADEFGEGGFDKGLRVEVPLDWALGVPVRQSLGTTLRPAQGDGGARLDVRNRLHDLTRDYREPEMADEWGRFFR